MLPPGKNQEEHPDHHQDDIVQKYLIERENLDGDEEEKAEAPDEKFSSGCLGQLQKQVGTRIISSAQGKLGSGLGAPHGQLGRPKK